MEICPSYSKWSNMEKCNNMKNASEYILSKQQDKICLVSELAPTQE